MEVFYDIKSARIRLEQKTSHKYNRRFRAHTAHLSRIYIYVHFIFHFPNVVWKYVCIRENAHKHYERYEYLFNLEQIKWCSFSPISFAI